MSPRTAFVLAVTGLLLATLNAADGDRRLRVVPSKALPTIEAVIAYKSGDGKASKGAPKPLLTLTKFDKPTALPGDGPFDVYARPKEGVAVPLAKKLSVRPGQTHELKLGDLLGTVEVVQNDNSPRAEKIVITTTDDPGPDEKGHSVVQVGSNYRVEMPVPDGFYAVWVVPANGARAQRVADRVRVLAGRNVRVGGE